MASPPPKPHLSVVQDAAASDASYRAGEVIAEKYRLLSVIGRGGMGSVWLAQNLVLHIDVAIKVVHTELASTEAAERLLVEARSAAQLTHPSIVRINDFGTTSRGDSFIVMELLNGESLAEVIQRKDALPAAHAVQLLLPICSALDAAHGRGIVHRDIKPENVILVADEAGNVTPKLVDFGVAKMGLETQAPLKSPTTTGERHAGRLTQMGSLVGSPTYMAPEQARGDTDVDHRADVWSLSVVLYETMVGVPPFDNEDVEKVLLSVLADTPTPTTMLGAGDQQLWSIVERGLAKRKAERWQSARELGEELAAWLLDQGVEVDIAGTALRSHWLGEVPNALMSDSPGSRPGSDLVGFDPLGRRGTPPRTSRPRVSRPPGARRHSGAPRDSLPSFENLERAADMLAPYPPRRPAHQRAARVVGVAILLVGLTVGGALLWQRGWFVRVDALAPAPTAESEASAIEPTAAAEQSDDESASEPEGDEPEPDEPEAHASSDASSAASAPRVPGPRRTAKRQTRAPPKASAAPTELAIPDEPNF